jgi:hypothetical protein
MYSSIMCLSRGVLYPCGHGDDITATRRESSSSWMTFGGVVGGIPVISFQEALHDDLILKC